MLLAFALALQTRGAVPSPRPISATDAATVDFLAHARHKETEFFYLWRKEWEGSLAEISSDLRLMSLHCHADGSWTNQPAPHLITTRFSRKSMCPIWFDVNEEERSSEAVAIDNALSDGARTVVRAARAGILRLLDSAAVIAPEDGWVTGQRVRLYVDQGQFDLAASVARNDCKLTDTYCALLAGYVLASSGDRHRADLAYAYAVSLMTLKERCVYMDIRVFIDAKDRPAYDPRDCPARDKINERFWWLADPLYSDPGNERLTIHLYRETLILLHSALTADERFDWRPAFGAGAAAEMIRRYGWPEFAYWDRTEDIEHFQWLGKFGDSSVNSSREYLLPRFHTTPDFAAAVNPATLDVDHFGEIAPKWNSRRKKWDDDWWPVEHFARSSSLIPLDYQAAVFRRAAGALVVVRTRPPLELLPDSVLSKYSARLFSMSGPADSGRRTARSANASRDGSVDLTIETAPGVHVLSAEIIQVDGMDAPAARARFAVTAPPGLAALAPGEVALSDIALFDAPASADSLPRSITDAISRMLLSADLRGPSRVGVFFEMYGVAQQSDVDVTLAVARNEQPGFIRRLGARLGLADLGGGSVVMRWRDAPRDLAGRGFMIGDESVQPRSLILDLTRMKPGRYSLEISIARPGEASVVSHREFTIRGK